MIIKSSPGNLGLFAQLIFSFFLNSAPKEISQLTINNLIDNLV